MQLPGASNTKFKVLRLVLGVVLIGGSSALAADPPSTSTYQNEIRPFLVKNCFSCHGNGEDKGAVSFEKYVDDQSVWKDRATWQSVREKLHAHEMPPPDAPQPAPAETESALQSIRALFDRFDGAVKPSAGRVTIRRLNRNEYNNTIRDLVGIDFKPAEEFPADDVGYGFDNIGDVLSVSTLLLEKYLSAAEAILDQAIVIVDPIQPSKTKFDSLRKTVLAGPGELGRLVSFEQGNYIIRCTVSADLPDSEPIRAMLRVADRDVQVFAISSATTIETQVSADPTTTRVALAMLNPSPAGDAKPRALHLHSIEIEGPFNAAAAVLPASHRKIMAHSPGVSSRDAAREIISRFATRAFRRPATPEEIDRCLALYDSQQKLGHRFEICVRAGLYRVLVSPNFLFRVELDPQGSAEGAEYPINEYELASRLSYFLWNSMPDDALFELAASGQLRQNLDAQVKRMIADPKASSFLHNFAEQWLTLRKLEFSSPDPKYFPDFTPALRDAMIHESLLFFETLVRDDRSLLELLDADFTFVNEDLAKHYGIPGVKGKGFVRVKLPAERGGILTQGSILTLTSNATRTSPVKRGKFVLEQILNTPPPPPPQDVPALEDQKELTGTMRQIMEQHRANPGCASCHQRLDPLGFAFENFDAIGVWRDKQAGELIDSSGVLPNGSKFNGPSELRRILRQDKALFVRCIVEKMLTYALGRGIEFFDRESVEKIVAEVDSNEDRFSTLILAIVKSDPFQKRVAAGGAK